MIASPMRRSIVPPCALDDGRDRDGEVGVEHVGDLARVMALREGREALEVGEEDRHLATPCHGVGRVERGVALLVPGLLRPPRDEHERGEHEHVPAPPRVVPVRGQDDRDHRLGEEDHRRRHRRGQQPTALPPEACVRHGGHPEEHDRHDARDDHRRGVAREPRPCSERPEPQQRGDAPHDHQQEQGESQDPRTAHLRGGPRRVDLAHRRHREERADGDADGGGDVEPGGGGVEQHVRASPGRAARGSPRRTGTRARRT